LLDRLWSGAGVQHPAQSTSQSTGRLNAACASSGIRRRAVSRFGLHGIMKARPRQPENGSRSSQLLTTVLSPLLSDPG
jgi:hypothetical protein